MSRAVRSALSVGFTSFVLFVSSALSANAQQVGVRGGVSVDPDQAFFGVHYETRPLIEHLTFRPNLELGVGDDITLVALNFEFAYWIPIQRTAWQLYLGAGPAVNIYSFDDDTEVEGGFNILLGVQHRRGLFTELKVGTMDSPDLKFTIGYVFNR